MYFIAKMQIIYRIILVSFLLIKNINKKIILNN